MSRVRITVPPTQDFPWGREVEERQTGISDLHLRLVHRTLLLPWAQRICHRSSPRRDPPGQVAPKHQATLISRSKNLLMLHPEEGGPEKPRLEKALRFGRVHGSKY